MVIDRPRGGADVVAATPFGRVATALGRPLAASIRDGGFGRLGTEHLHPSGDTTALIESVGPLDCYQAYGAGYERAGPGEPAVGRYVFAYARAAQAEADLPGRQRLIEEGSNQAASAGSR
jgi:hypothetical protein